jgi:hypothetical protein
MIFVLKCEETEDEKTTEETQTTVEIEATAADADGN